jgi:histidine triad (HIT) family protein
MTYDRNNVFARILRGEIPAAGVYEDEHTLAFMDAMPQSEGHTLIIPRCEAQTLFDIDPAMLGKLIVVTQRVAKAVRSAFDPPGVRVMQFNFAAAGQTVFHFHFHVIPFYDNTTLKPHGRESASPERLTAHAERIRKALAAS